MTRTALIRQGVRAQDGAVFRRQQPAITACEARAIAETACAAAGRRLEEPVTVRLTWPRHRTWYVSGRADVKCAGGPYVSVDARTGAVLGIARAGTNPDPR